MLTLLFIIRSRSDLTPERCRVFCAPIATSAEQVFLSALKAQNETFKTTCLRVKISSAFSNQESFSSNLSTFFWWIFIYQILLLKND
ncbi:hypothetical protein NPIL_313771 [Nephila pilipes]|uniref:Uncharacterized protein n=1 Tax=Nephila pilipes TaxID=299642 RepID=A0A8X6P5L3_NEPPI|nr:hypothetical protein NPIL_313771 [Nephila pilipes]